MTSPAPLPSSDSKVVRANWLGRYLEVEQRFDKRLKDTLTDAMDHVDEAFDSVKENFSGKVRRQQYAAAKKSMRDTLSYTFGVTHENIKDLRKDAAIAAVDAELYEERGILGRIFKDPVQRQQYADSLRQTASRNVENVVARTLFSERPLSKQVWKTEALANNLVSQAINRGIARGDTAKEIAASVKHMINPDVPGGISYAARRLGTTEVNNAFHATAIKSAQDTPWVQQMEWHLSKRHVDDPGDECEIYALQKLFDIEHVPDKPHPFCRCYVTPKQQDYEDFENSLLSGQYDDHIDKVLGIEPDKVAQEAVWPEGTTDRVKAEYERAKAAKKTSFWPPSGATAAEKKASMKLSARLAAEAEAAQQVSAQAVEKQLAKRVKDATIPKTLAEAENSVQVGNFLLDRYDGLQVEGFDFADLDVRSTKEIGEAFISQVSKHPRTNIRSLRIVDTLPENVNAETRYDGKKGFSEILFSRKHVAAYDDFKINQKNRVKTGYLSKASRDIENPWYSTTVHEWGHVLDFSGRSVVERSMNPLNKDQAFAAYGLKREMQTGPGLFETFYNMKSPDHSLDITAELAEEYEKWVMSSAPSDYALDLDGDVVLGIDPIEFVAESYLESVNNPKPHSVSKAIARELLRNVENNRLLKIFVRSR